jgi:uncharacterized membrane protein
MFDLQSLTKFARLSVLVLAIEWILFGSMHFSMTRETADMLPGFLQPAATPIVVITGVLEVATGILILIPKIRREAAMGSIALLILLLPAMYTILASPSEHPSMVETLFRIVLIPNNIFLAICSVHLLDKAVATPVTPLDTAATDEPRLSRRRAGNGAAAMIVPAILLLANCAGFMTLAIGAPAHKDIAFLWAMACLASGALIGFLFAVPRLNPAARVTTRLMPNTNVEAVSDWLTKILVGVGLVNFSAIGGFVEGRGKELADAMATAKPFATGLIVYFFIAGIIEGYILTRLFLATQFRNSD